MLDETSLPYQDSLPIELEAAIEKHDRQQLQIEHRQGWGATTGGKALTEYSLELLATAIRENLTKEHSTKSAESSLLAVLQGLDVNVISLCILQNTLHSIAQRADERQMYLNIGKALEGECWAAGLTAVDDHLAAAIRKRVKRRHSHPKSRLAAARVLAAKSKYSFKLREWPRELRLRAGAWGVELMLAAVPNVFSWVLQEDSAVGRNRDTFNKLRVLELTDAAWSVVDDALHKVITRNPVFFPLTSPPRPWTQWSGCGSNDARVDYTVTFLRSHGKDTAAAAKAAIQSGQMQPALDGVNRLQAVPWAINTRVMDVIQHCYNHGISVPGLPDKDDIPVPGRETDAVWAAMTADERRLKRIHVDELKRLNRATRSERLLFAQDMQVAQSMAEAGRFYTPMNCDWRGRVYPLPHFNFQREDRVRALFLFADGAPMTEDGLWWLKVHVANCGDFDKISKRPLQERVEWVDANFPMIRAIAENTSLSTAEWKMADKPFLFVASCIELTAALENGPLYTTRLPVSFDGSCSGLQHLSAMTRASEGALVNLTPCETPQDIYENVASLVRERLTADLDHEPESSCDDKQVAASNRTRALAQCCLNYGITRKEVKRNVMTYAYSSKRFGMAAQIQEDLMQPLAREVLEGKREEHPFEPYHFGDREIPGIAARYLANHIFSAIEERVHKPSEAMKLLQKLAKVMAHEGKPLRWVTPVGIPWINRYHDPIMKRVELWLNDNGVKLRSRISLAVGQEREINKDKAANGVAPNFVHALDASHLLLVANAAGAEGIHQVATIHDSFGCLAPQARRFNEIIREQMVRMYEDHDVLAEVLQQATCDLTPDNQNRLPDGMQYGPLNLKDILHADFAFA